MTHECDALRAARATLPEGHLLHVLGVLAGATLEAPTERPVPPAAGGPQRVKVGEGRLEDVGQARAYLSVAQRLDGDITVGDTVLIEGPKGRAAAMAWRHTEDRPGVAFLDGLLRGSVGAELGDEVTVRRVEPAPAERVELDIEYPETAYAARDAAERLRDLLARQRRALVRGELVTFAGVTVGGDRVLFRVAFIGPETADGAVRVVPETRLRVRTRKSLPAAAAIVRRRDGAPVLCFANRPDEVPLTEDQVKAFEDMGVPTCDEGDEAHAPGNETPPRGAGGSE